MKSERVGCKVVPSKWFLDFLDKGKGGRTIVVWSISASKLLISKQVRSTSELVLLLDALAKRHGVPECIECDRAEIDEPAVQGWISGHGSRVMIRPVSNSDPKVLIETLHHEHELSRVSKIPIPGPRRSSRAM